MKNKNLLLSIFLIIAPTILKGDHKVIFRYPKESNMVLRIWFNDTANRPHYATVGEDNGYTKKINGTNYKCREISIERHNFVYPDIKDTYVDVWYKSIEAGNFRGRYHFEKNITIKGDENTEVFFKYDPKEKRPLQRKVIRDGKVRENYNESGLDNSSIRIIPDWIISNYVDPKTDYQPWAKPETIFFIELPWETEVDDIKNNISVKFLKYDRNECKIDINANTTKHEITTSPNDKLFIKNNAGTVIGCKKDTTYNIVLINGQNGQDTYIKSSTSQKIYELRVSEDGKATITDPPLNF